MRAAGIVGSGMKSGGAAIVAADSLWFGSD
jgi:hypothetical protein